MPMTPNISATPAATASRTMVKAICADALSTMAWSVVTSASASLGSTRLTAPRTEGSSADGGVVERTTKAISATSGPSNAVGGMPGPPAIDIGMYNCDAASGSASDRLGVFETTPTISSGVGPGAPSARAGGALDDTYWPRGF